MARPRTFYGWNEGGKFYLSALPASEVEMRPRNEYASKEAAEAEAKKRRATIEWED